MLMFPLSNDNEKSPFDIRFIPISISQSAPGMVSITEARTGKKYPSIITSIRIMSCNASTVPETDETGILILGSKPIVLQRDLDMEQICAPVSHFAMACVQNSFLSFWQSGGAATVTLEIIGVR